MQRVAGLLTCLHAGGGGCLSRSGLGGCIRALRSAWAFLVSVSAFKQPFFQVSTKSPPYPSLPCRTPALPFLPSTANSLHHNRRHGVKMPSLKSLTLALLFAVATALALPTNLNANTIASRADPSATCGSNSYSSSAVQAAQNAGCKYLQQGSTVGNDDYVSPFPLFFST